MLAISWTNNPEHTCLQENMSLYGILISHIQGKNIKAYLFLGAYKFEIRGSLGSQFQHHHITISGPSLFQLFMGKNN